MENKDSVKIVGIKIAPSSKNPNVFYYNYYYMGQFGDYDLEHAEVSGNPCGVEFATVDIGCNVGDVVEFKYRRGYQDKAQLVGCIVLKSANATK